MACRNCKHLIVNLTGAGKRVVRKDGVYRCGYEIPALILPLLPASVTNDRNFKWPPHKSWVGPDDERECSTFEKLK